MDIVYWLLISLLIIIGFLGLIYPVIPSVLFILGSFVLYGFIFSFESFNLLFWLVQGMFTLLLFGADYVANLIGVKKYGGTKAGVIGSTIGILFGPFIIPIFGIILGPFIGAVLAEIIVHKKNLNDALKIGAGSVVGFISSIFTKGLIQLVMVGYFLMVVL